MKGGREWAVGDEAELRARWRVGENHLPTTSKRRAPKLQAPLRNTLPMLENLLQKGVVRIPYNTSSSSSSSEDS